MLDESYFSVSIIKNATVLRNSSAPGRPTMTLDIEDAVAMILAGCLLWAAWSDVAARIIPDSACVAIALLGLVSRARLGASPVLQSLGLALALFLALLIVHARGWFGGGDVKLTAAVVLGMAPMQVMRFLLLTSIAGFCLAMTHLLLRRLAVQPPASEPRSLWRRVFRAELWRIRRHGSLPYGVAVACGGAWVLFTNPGG